MSILEGIGIALEAGIYQNTADTAQASMLPEYAKEAAWLSNGFFAEIRKKSIVSRFAWNSLMAGTVLLSFGNWDETNNDHSLWFAIGALFVWSIINSTIKKSTRQKAANKAWAIVNAKKMKEETIRDAMYSAAVNRARIAQ